MKIYNYNYFTGEYIYSSDADESPLEVGVYLIPANATVKIPPITGVNQVTVYENNDWVIKPDYRRQTACIIDVNGFFLEEHYFVIGEEPNATLILANVPDDDIYKPKWNGIEWIQGQVPPEPELSLAEKNRADIDYILLMQGL